MPDERITWTTEGAKGTVKGVVTFHALTDNLTRVLLVLEYFPGGLFEKTGNIWRAQGRRARLDLKLYRKFIMTRGEATDGWRGEIRDGEVVVGHEEAVEEEEREREEAEARGEPEADTEPGDDLADAEDAEDVDEEPDDDAYDEEADDAIEDEYDEDEAEPQEDEETEEPDLTSEEPLEEDLDADEAAAGR